MKWYDTTHCQSRLHCHKCRESRAFRESVVRAGLATEVDFPCPFLRLGDLIETIAKPVAKLLRLPCVKPDSSLKPDSGCAKRRDKLNQLNAKTTK